MPVDHAAIAEGLKAAIIGRFSDRLVLLGAGSSMEAGLPDGKGLARTIIDTGDAPALEDILHNLTRRRSYPDVERAFSVLEALADFDRASSFVADLAAAGLTRPRNGLPATPMEAKAELDLVVHTLRRCLWLVDGLGTGVVDAILGDPYKTPPATRYMAPLVADCLGGTIATLNYDNVVELAGGPSVVVRDLSRKTKRVLVPDEQVGRVRLLKLHGSLDWRRIDDDVIAGARPREKEYYTPAVIFGAANKLRHYGPFLDLLRALVSKLNTVHYVVVIGYGFRDQHINEVLRIWAGTRAPDGRQKRLTICQGPEVNRLPEMVERWAVHDHLLVDPPLSMPASEASQSSSVDIRYR